MSIIQVLHISIILLFVAIILYSLFVDVDNIVEGMDNEDASLSKTTTADIITINKQLGELSNINPRIEKIDKQSKINEDEIKMMNVKMAEMAKNAETAQNAEMAKNTEQTDV
jgi:hypothetical protein